jgi:hypothetical protein
MMWKACLEMPIPIEDRFSCNASANVRAGSAFRQGGEKILLERGQPRSCRASRSHVRGLFSGIPIGISIARTESTATCSNTQRNSGAISRVTSRRPEGAVATTHPPRHPSMPYSKPRLFCRWPSEPRGIDCDIRLHFFDLRGIAPVQPRKLVFERELDTANVTIVGIIDLNRDAAYG